MTKRETLRAWLQEQQWAPYIFGSKGGVHALPGGKQVACFDCSGLVTCGLLEVGGPDWRQTHGAAGLFEALGHVDFPAPLDLAAYGPPGHVDHVMFWWGDGRMYGASGGDSTTTTVASALSRRACVHFKTAVSYRPDFRCYLRLPLPLDEVPSV